MPVDAKSLSAHIDAVRALARALLGDEDAADDVAQDAAVIALESGAAVRSPRGWFAGVARNLSHRKIRDRTRRRRREHAAARPESQGDAAELVGRANEQRRVLDHLVRLEDPYRDVLLLRFFEGLPPREIAKRRGTPVETVRTHVRRGIATLRERLETELRTDGRTWRQGLLLAAGLGAQVTRRAPGALAPKAAIAAGLLLVVGGTAWWAVDTLEGSSAPVVPEEVVADSAPTTVTPATTPSKAPATLTLPDWVPPPRKDPAPQPPPQPAAVADVPAPTVATSEQQSDKSRKRLEKEQKRRDRQHRKTRARQQPPARQLERIHVPFRTTDGGMVKLPRARVRIGSNEDWARTYARSGEARSLVGVEFEAPAHLRTIEEVFIDRFEITNAQFELYLKDVGEVVDFHTGDFKTRRLTDVISVLWGPEALAVDGRRAARQLYLANAAVLAAEIPNRVVRTDEGDVDPERTFQRFYERELPRGIPLRFYARPIPPEWPGMEPESHKRNHPVVGISYAEALAFAEWAGKHIPSEFEWEYAARGPSSYPWPWGATARGFEQRVNGGYARTADNPPDTAAVNTWVGGLSPFGCYHMLGNASEWTSSILWRYPNLAGFALPDGIVRWVIRGGSANNAKQGAVRPMFRGWEDPRALLRGRARREADVVPDQTPFTRVPWAGFRCAWFEDPAVSRTVTMRQRLMVSSRIPAAFVDAGHFVALESSDFAEDGAIISDGTFVLGRAYSLVLQPFTMALAQTGAEQLGVLQAPNVVDLPKLNTALGNNPLYLGLFHTDWPLHLSTARVIPSDPRREPTWYGPKELTGTYVVYYAREQLWMWHLYTGRQFRLPRGTFHVREGAKPFNAAEPKVVMRAQPVRRSNEGRVHLRLQVPFSESVDAKHLWLDVTASFDLDRPETDRPLRPPVSGGR